MTNNEIIFAECAKRGIDEEVHTFAVWKSMGYSVKKGEHSAFSTKIWKSVKRKNLDENLKEKSSEKENENENGGSRLVLTTAHFFKSSQVEEIKEVNNIGQQ